jgi:hypothetical protein
MHLIAMSYAAKKLPHEVSYLHPSSMSGTRNVAAARDVADPNSEEKTMRPLLALSFALASAVGPASQTMAVAAPAKGAPAKADAPMVTIDGDEPVRIGGMLVDPGRYEVRIDESRERIVLQSGVRTYALTGFFRAAKISVKSPEAQLRRVEGEPRRLLVVRLPPGVEWVA